MRKPALYWGNWSKTPGKIAKYSVRKNEQTDWAVFIDHIQSEKRDPIEVDTRGADIVERVNKIKRSINGKDGGSFYISEYKRLIIPGKDTFYYPGDEVECNFEFNFDGNRLTNQPINSDGKSLKSGDIWYGPRPGMRYYLASGGNDIYYKGPVLTDTTPQRIVQDKFYLSEKIDETLLSKAVQPFLEAKGSKGGRFYVNEHCAIFSPVSDDVGLHFEFCGKVDLDAWFPDPMKESI